MASIKLTFKPAQLQNIVNLYRLGFSDIEVATSLGVNVKRLRRWLKRRDNAPLRLRIEQQKINQKALMRDALVRKAAGSKGKDGTPQIINVDEHGNRKVMQDGVAGVPPVPGDLNAQKFWLTNRDDTMQWRDIKQTQLAGPDGKPLPFQPQQMAQKELIEYILGAITDGTIPSGALSGNGSPPPPKRAGGPVHTTFREIKNDESRK